MESKENKTRKEQMLMDFYHSGTNLKLHNQLGYEPIKPYLENYKNANSIEELINAEVLLYKEMGISVLFNFQNDYIVTEFSVLPILNTDFYKTLENQEKYQSIVENLLILAEHDDLNAKKISKREAPLHYNTISRTQRPRSFYGLDTRSVQKRV